ncbi:MAG: Aerobic respiration control sensor protein ArcB [Chlamydiae bacterium]|nr:Aerobic respiration control sensor protein ArcB [Chlamydiota bacterium]
MNEKSNEFAGTRILIVEDNPINQVVTKENLEKVGCQVDMVGSGKEALVLIPDNTYDFIFMDIQMPDMDGYEATKQIRAKEKNGKKTLIIALTANVTPEDREKCFQAGMDDYIPKPIELNTLANMLRKHSN